MKSVTWADLKRPGDAASCAPTHSPGAMGHGGMSDIFQLLCHFFLRFPGFFPSVWAVKSSHFLLFFPSPSCPQSCLEPWVWASTAVSNLLIPTKNLNRLCHDMLCAFFFSLVVISARAFVFQQVCTACGSAVCSVAVLQECVERSCVGACRSYFRLSWDAAAAAAAAQWCSNSLCPLTERLICR